MLVENAAPRLLKGPLLSKRCHPAPNKGTPHHAEQRDTDPGRTKRDCPGPNNDKTGTLEAGALQAGALQAGVLEAGALEAAGFRLELCRLEPCRLKGSTPNP